MHSVCVSFTEAKLTAVQDYSHEAPNIPTTQQFFFCSILSLSLSLQVSPVGCSALARVHLRDHRIPTRVNSKHIFPLFPHHKVFALEHCSPTEQLATIPNRYKHTFNHFLCIHGPWLIIAFTAQGSSSTSGRSMLVYRQWSANMFAHRKWLMGPTVVPYRVC